MPERPWGRWPSTQPYGGQTRCGAMPADPAIVAQVGIASRISSARPSTAKRVTTIEQKWCNAKSAVLGAVISVRISRDRCGARRAAPPDAIDTDAGVLAELAAFPKADTLPTADAAQRHSVRGMTIRGDKVPFRFLAPRTRAFSLCTEAAIWLGRRGRVLLLLLFTLACGSPNSSGLIARTRRGVSRRHYYTSGAGV